MNSNELQDKRVFSNNKKVWKGGNYMPYIIGMIIILGIILAMVVSWKVIKKIIVRIIKKH